MAGVAQMKDGAWKLAYGLPIFLTPYGDDPEGQDEIGNGIAYAKE